MISYDFKRTNSIPLIEKKKIQFRSLMILSFALFLFFSIFNRAQYGASFSYVALPCFLFVLIFLARKIINAKSLLIFAFFLIYLISTLTSPYVGIGSDMVTFLILCIVYCSVVSFDFDSEIIKIIINIYIIIALICSANVIYQWLTHNYYQPWVQRSSFYFLGTFKDPNYTMAYVVPAAFFTFVKLLSGRKKIFNKLLLFFAIAIFGFACLATTSRGAIFSLLVSCLFYFLISNQVKLKNKVRFLILLFIIGSIAISIALSVLSESAILRFTGDTDGAGRLTLWKAALKCFYAKPLIGGGMNAGTFFSNNYAGNATHNVYIDILCDSGIIGSLIFIVFCITNLVKSKKINRHFQIACFIAFFLPLFFINGFNTTSFYLPIFLLGILSNHNLKYYYRNII